MSSKKMSAALIAWLAVVSQGVLAGPALELKLSGPDQVDGVDAFNVLATLTNTGDEHLSLYNEPMGILSKMPTNTFKVTRAKGGEPSYVGPQVKYSYAKATSFTELDPGQSIDIQHDLSRAYDFDQDGEYDILPGTTFFYKNAAGEPVEIQANLVRAHSAKLSGSLHSRALQKRHEDYHSLMKREAITSGCTSSQTDIIVQSTWYASHYAASAEKYLAMNTQGTERYAYWFGEYDDTNHETVLTHYTNIRSSDVKTYTYDCACEEGEDVFAYVYPDQFGHIYLCGQYMAADLTGTDSKAGTIIHESSHFTRNAGTRDYVYGHTRAHDLAQTNATLAVRNADSHEYFAENENPALD